MSINTPNHIPDARKMMPTPDDYAIDPAADLAIQQAATPGDWIAWQAKSCPASISPEPFGEVIGVPRVYADKTQYFRPGDAVAIAAAHNNAPAWLRRLIAAEEAILDSQARTGHHYDTDGVADMVGERVAWLRERLAAAEAAEVECAYCGHMTPPAPPTDEEGWLAAAKQHRDGCEWVATRAHTR